jgi:hypothetical protein
MATARAFEAHACATARTAFGTPRQRKAPGGTLMTWIKMTPPTESAAGREVLQKLDALYPREYNPARRHERMLPDAVKNDSIMASHSLIPQAMYHAFATFGALMAPSLPLSRRQHETFPTTIW